jgi:hypothetical protein
LAEWGIVLTTVVVIVVLGTAIWVDRDARKLIAAGATKQQLGGSSPIVWGIGTILVWIIVFPWYLSKRGKIQRELGMVQVPGGALSQAPASPPPGPLPAIGWYVDPTNALQQRFWDGAAWTSQVRVSPPST